MTQDEGRKMLLKMTFFPLAVLKPSASSSWINFLAEKSAGWCEIRKLEMIQGPKIKPYGLWRIY
jgi:hypothetical protein